MNFNLKSDDHSPMHDLRIDAALHHYGQAVPAPDFESRVASRIAAAPRLPAASTFARSGRAWIALLRGISVGALAAAGACGIIVGTVRHSQQIAIPQARSAPHAGGISTAGTAHVPTHAVQQSSKLNPSDPRTPPRSRSVEPAGKPAPQASPR